MNTADVHLMHTRSGEPACRTKEPTARRSRDLPLITCAACLASTHYAARLRNKASR